MNNTITAQEITERMPAAYLADFGARIMADRQNEYAARRCWLPEDTLQGMAREIAKHITVRTYDNGNSHDERRTTTDAEADILYKLAYSALLGLDASEQVLQSKAAEDAIINAIEYTCLLMLPEANSYDSLYIPLRRLMENWRNHTEAELNLRYGNC